LKEIFLQNLQTRSNLKITMARNISWTIFGPLMIGTDVIKMNPQWTRPRIFSECRCIHSDFISDTELRHREPHNKRWGAYLWLVPLWFLFQVPFFCTFQALILHCLLKEVSAFVLLFLTCILSKIVRLCQLAPSLKECFSYLPS
jgi:hypothetical protein